MDANKEIKTIKNNETESIKSEVKAKGCPFTETEKQRIILKTEKVKKIEKSCVCKFQEKADESRKLDIVHQGQNQLNEHEKYVLYSAQISAATGAADTDYAFQLLKDAEYCSITDRFNKDEDFNAVMGALLAIAPKDEIEGMLCTRLVALHSMYMGMLRCVKNNDEGIIFITDHAITNATKLMRVYNETLEALQKYRRKGEQKVVVQHQHVNVNDGGKAVVNPQFNHGGGGNDKK